MIVTHEDVSSAIYKWRDCEFIVWTDGDVIIISNFWSPNFKHLLNAYELWCNNRMGLPFTEFLSKIYSE
jgi:hypothetical protein